MDPTEALERIRAHMKTLLTAEKGTRTKSAWDGLLEDVVDLDDWLTAGGFLPEQWTLVRGRRRREGDGPVILADVEHGKARSYNIGCRCVPCTKANRMKGAQWRANKRMEE